jgi:hypothetical protein
MKPLYFITALFFASHAFAMECKTDFCKLSQAMRDMSGKVTYDKQTYNCTDFTYDAWKFLEARGFKQFAALTLTREFTSSSLSHMVLLVNGRWILSIGESGINILPLSYIGQWHIVEGL